MTRILPLAVLAVAMTVAACGGAGPTPTPPSSPKPTPSPIVTPTPTPLPEARPVVVTFKAANGKTWKQRLVHADDIEIAWKHARGEEAPSIPNGKIVRSGPDVNDGWSWHLDPDDFEWADLAVEVCDGLPDYVEDFSLTSDRYCSWHAEVVSVVELS